MTEAQREAKKLYRETHKEQIRAYKKHYMASHAEEIREYAKEYSKKHYSKNKINKNKYCKELHKELRQQVIELYSHGTCKCSRCGGPVEHLHHTNPEDGKYEKETFGKASTNYARKHQLEMYMVMPDYITPLCKKCHKEVHRELRNRE
jgi:hypothetical protein